MLISAFYNFEIPARIVPTTYFRLIQFASITYTIR